MIERFASALSRRGLLLGLAASATAAASASPAVVPAENPALIVLADDLPALLAAHLDARAEVAPIVAEWSPHWPEPDPRIFIFSKDSKPHATIDGRPIATSWNKAGTIKDVKHIGMPEHFASSAAYHQAEADRLAQTKSKRGMGSHVKWAESDRATVEPARAYWSEVERIKQASGIDAAKDRVTATREALHAKVDQIMAADDWTIAGAVIKAQALGAWAKVDDLSRMVNLRGPVWADQLAAAILRHAGASGQAA